MTQAFRVTVKPTFRDLQGRFARADEALLAAKRDELRTEGRYIVELLSRRLEAKIGPNKIEKGIRFNTRETGTSVKLNVTAPGKARPHRIEARNKKALAFFWGKVGMQVFVPKRGGFRTHVRGGNLWIGKGGVDHPGGSLVPLIRPILKDVSEEWTRSRGRIALRRMATRYATELTK